jgi:hypothetical protein
LALGLQVATAIENLWVTHDAGEAMRGFAALLDHPGARAVPPEVRGPALRAYGSAAYISGDTGRAMRLSEESLALFESSSETCLVAPYFCTDWASVLSSAASCSERAS